MSFFRMALGLPQPARTFLIGYLVSFVVLVLSVVAGNGTIGMILVGAFSAALGTTLATNYRGSAAAYGDMLRAYKPAGVDYSQSLFVRTNYIRFFGAAVTVVGVAFLYGAFTVPS